MALLWGPESQRRRPLPYEPLFSHRCASAPTWTRRGGWCRAGRRALCGHTAWQGWPPAWATSCSQSAEPASASSMGIHPAALAPPRAPCCQQSRGDSPSCCCHVFTLGRGWGWGPSQCCFPDGCLLQERQLLPAIPWDALNTCPHPLGLEGSVCTVWSELGRGGGTCACPGVELWV